MYFAKSLYMYWYKNKIINKKKILLLKFDQ